MTDLNLTVHNNGSIAATLTLQIEAPKFQLFDPILTMRGKTGIVTGVCLGIEAESSYWTYFLSGPELDSSLGWEEREFNLIELGKSPRPRFKRPTFKLFDRVSVVSGEHGFISGVDLVGTGKSAIWQFNVFGAGIDPNVFFVAEALQPHGITQSIAA